MESIVKRSGIPALASLVLLGFLPEARAQFGGSLLKPGFALLPPGLTLLPPGLSLPPPNLLGRCGIGCPPGTGVYPNTYLPGSVVSGNYYLAPVLYDPYGLRGTAEVINSEGRFLINNQKANLAKEEIVKERIENRRRAFEESLLERERTPTPQDERERIQKLELRRSQNGPPVTEIWSAKALNDLLVDLQKLQAKGIRGPQVPLNEEMLRHINVASGMGSGNAGLLKNEGRLNWPMVFQAPEFKTERVGIDQLAPKVVGQVKKGGVDPADLHELTGALEKMRNQLAANIKELPVPQYIRAKRFLNDLEDAVKVLHQPDAANYFNQVYAAKGKTVAELVGYLTEKGLRFAPAVAGDETAYTALHQALVSYDLAANSLLAAER